MLPSVKTTRSLNDTQSVVPLFAETPRASEIRAIVRDHFEERFLPAVAALDSNLDIYQQYKAAFWEIERDQNWMLMRTHTCNEQHQNEETQKIVRADVISFYTTGSKKERRKTQTLQQLDREISDDYAGPTEAEIAFNEDDVDASYFEQEDGREDSENMSINGVFMGLRLRSLGQREANDNPLLLVDLSPLSARRLAGELLQIASWHEQARNALPYSLRHPLEAYFYGE